MMIWVLFVLLALLLLGGVYLVRMFWRDYVQIYPEDEEFQDRVASLNDSQSNRLNDMQLICPPDPDLAWSEMVRRGHRRRHRG